MKPAALHLRIHVAWLALAAHILFGGSAAAGIVTCFGFDGHIAAEWPHARAVAKAVGSSVNVQSAGHGPCIDLGAESPAVTTQEQVLPFSDASASSVPLAILSARSASRLLVGSVWPMAPPGGGTALEFAETIRLLI